MRRALSFFFSSVLIVVGVLGALLIALPTARVKASQNCDDIQCSKESQSEDDYLTCNKNKQGCWEEKIKEAQNTAGTLNGAISILNGKISVQVLQIDQTLAEIKKLEREINELTARISGLNMSLDRLSTIFVKRVQEQYKKSFKSPVAVLLGSHSLDESVIQYRYVTNAQEQTTMAMHQAEQQKQTYDEQKLLKEDKQNEVEKKKIQLEQQQGELTKQRAEQQFLLQETKNSEARYQKELEKTLAELEAIQSIIAGKGDESRVNEVKSGDKIASIIVGASPCSTGTHLHFEVTKDGTHRDPAGYLKPIDASWSNQPDNSFGFGGDWNWPIDNAARINQGYGMTYYARVRRAYGGAPHTGIDMVSKDSGSNGVKAVKDGTLFRGSVKCGGGLLKYVKVEHKDDGISTYYLHVNY